MAREDSVRTGRVRWGARLALGGIGMLAANFLGVACGSAPEGSETRAGDEPAASNGADDNSSQRKVFTACSIPSQ